MNGCRKDPFQPTPIGFTIPQGFPQPQYNFLSNPLSEEGFQLGKKLFFDGRLSKNGNFPCGSCHQPVAAFTTFEHDRSHGYNNSHTLRNAPGLFNLAWHPSFNQDGSATNLETVIARHINEPREMGESVSNVVNKLKNDAQYRSMFRAAFRDDGVTAERMFMALSQFLVSMVSAGSKYDAVKNGTASFNAQEGAGYQVFQSKCGSCHTEPLFTDFSFRNTGLPLDAGLNDGGRIRVTGSLADSMKFRVPSLRNVMLTSYYGHDGRFSLPRHMIVHYRTGVQPGANVDPLVKNGIALTDEEENNLVHFMRTLSDSTFLNNPRFRE